MVIPLALASATAPAASAPSAANRTARSRLAKAASRSGRNPSSVTIRVVAAGASPVVEAVSAASAIPATKTAWMLVVGDVSTGVGMAAARSNPFASRNDSQPWRSRRRESGRRSVSVKRHQPSVRPKVMAMKRSGSTISVITRRPPGASSDRTLANVEARSAVAWSTLVATTRSKLPGSKPWASGSASMSRVVYSTIW